MSALPARPLLETRAIDLLGRGYNQEVVASTLGVSPGRISQLMEDDSFRGEVASLRALRLQENEEHDANIDSAEAKVLRKLDSMIGMIDGPVAAARVFQILNGSKRRSRPSEVEPNIQNTTVVNLTLPTQVLHRYETNPQGQVVEVDGKPLITLPSNKLEEVARNAYPEATRYKPNPNQITRSGQAPGPEDI